MRTIHILGILVLLALAVPAAPAHAGGVVTVCDEAHLLAALAGGGTVTFACSGTITLTNTITIAADTTIDGSGQDVTISGNDAVRVFTVNSGVTLHSIWLTIADGSSVYGVGGGIQNEGTLSVSNITFSGNRAEDGGAIYNLAGTVTVSNCTFSGNEAGINGYGVGAGICNYGGMVTVNSSVFSGNMGGQGVGIWNFGTLIVSDSTFSDNTSGGMGGGICNADNSTAMVSDSIFSGNSAGWGAGIYNWSPNGTVQVSNSTFSFNSANSEGGAMYNFGSGTVQLYGSTLSGNDAARGGGIYNWGGGQVEISNGTFYGNSATQEGGAISNSDNGMVEVFNSTFSGNGAYPGGGIYNYIATMTIANTIIANSPRGGNCSGYPPITDGGGNLSFPDATCPGINADPKLGPLQNNLGPTLTMALGPGSAAIDAGIDAICAAAPVNGLDQRGIVRPWGAHCDIGAVEQVPIKKLWLPILLSR